MSLTLRHNFMENPQLPQGFTLDRSSRKYFEDSDGLLRITYSDMPAIKGATYAANVVLQSEDLDTNWNLTGLTVSEVTGSVDPPSGGPTKVWQINQTATTNRHELTTGTSYLTSSGRMMWAMRVKEGVDIRYIRTIWGGGVQDWFYWDIVNGTAHVGSANTTSGIPGITDLGDGWYLIYVYGNWTPNANTTLNIDYFVQQPSSRLSTELGAADNYVYVTGIQGEDGGANTTPNTYLKTTTDILVTLTGASEGFLHEPPATNIWLNSEDVSSWVLSKTVITTNQENGPDGSLKLDLITDDNAGGSSSSIYVRQTNLIVTSGRNCQSFWVKRGSLDWCAIRVSGFDAGAEGYSYFNINTGRFGYCCIRTHNWYRGLDGS